MSIEAISERDVDGFLSGRTSFGRMVGLTGDDLARIFSLGVSCFSASDYHRARVVFEIALRIEPTLPVGPMYLGLIADNEGNVEDALARYEDAAELLKECPRKPKADALRSELHLLRASALLRLNRRAAASAQLDALDGQRLSRVARTELDRLRKFSEEDQG